ncbi:DUF4405 domain-containing protein [Streptomyces fulvoviolaceus]|uniref:DUF4405 domain-containing protein n=1 Tax=Streptomyces fulvoviolaceus TaxID=285535 RepID=UPI00131AAEA4|nr:DUF4405 domain-containing protein [Streptomyces fulvoviolaceus]
MLLAMAHQWTGDLYHELIGVVLFAGVLIHNAIHLRWYARLPRNARNRRHRLTILVNVLLLISMTVLLGSSLVVSREVFAFLGLSGGATGRQVHILAATATLILVAIHLGMYWQTVMGVVRTMVGRLASSRAALMVLRILVVVAVAYGVKASFELDVGTKLVGYYSFGYWDFENDTVGFFAGYASIVAMYAALAHYLRRWGGKRQRAKSSVTSRKARGRGASSST